MLQKTKEEKEKECHSTLNCSSRPPPPFPSLPRDMLCRSLGRQTAKEPACKPCAHRQDHGFHGPWCPSTAQHLGGGGGGGRPTQVGGAGIIEDHAQNTQCPRRKSSVTATTAATTTTPAPADVEQSNIHLMKYIYTLNYHNLICPSNYKCGDRSRKGERWTERRP